MERELLEYFKCMIVDKRTKSLNFQFMTKGILLDFTPTPAQEKAIKRYTRDANISTLFSVEEVNNLSTDEKILKQINHYVLQFGTEYNFDVVRNVGNGDSITITLIRGVTAVELQKLIDDSLYSNRPVKDSKILADIIKHYDCKYRINDIKNNELRVLLFNVNKDIFNSGDDAVRYIVNTCTESDLLIKSKQVITAITTNRTDIPVKFLQNHKTVLAQVFNRHKQIIMALKIGSKDTAVKTAINRISHASKELHVPYITPLSKSFVSDVFKNIKKYKFKNLETFTAHDKLKILNLLEFKLAGLSTDIFTIRNGKMHVAEDRPIYDRTELREVIDRILKSLKKDLEHLKDKVIVLPDDIDYGLPVSRKQSVGNLPFGTKIIVDTPEISSGMYWRDEWGARDIDLSAIDEDGNRTGWGSRYGYDRGGTTGVQFSGDIVSAPNGAMEFLTSSSENYGLFANIFNGNLGSKVQIVVGQKEHKQWIEKTIIREDLTLKARGNLVGLVRGKTFIVFYGRMNESRISEARNKIMIRKALTMHWTVKALFAYLHIEHVTEAKKPDFDLSYAGFTYNKLEALFGI